MVGGNETNKSVTDATLKTRVGGDDGSLISSGPNDQLSVISDDTRVTPSSQRSSNVTQGDAVAFRSRDGGELAAIAKREGQAIAIWKGLVVFFFTLIAVGVAAGVYFYVDSHEQADYDANYEENANEVFGGLGRALFLRFAQLDSLTVALTAYAGMDANPSARWPMVTMPDYAVMVAKARSLSQAVAFEQYNFVTNNSNDRAEWEDYARSNGNGWIQHTLAVQKADQSYYGTQPTSESVAELSAMNGIQYGSEIVPPNSGP
jgi:hypothetical protein